MRWQFGGNLQPVRMICEIDWRECPYAIINYVWSEIVTDVVECLTNEWMIWRVIAMLFVCSVLIHTIYSKTKLIDETSINRKNLNVVGCKVQDLELKVNILTYKMQYGTWPLPRQIHGSGVGRELRNVRLTLTNSNDRNAWIKHMLLSPSENASCVPYAKIGPRSMRCLTKLINLETKYMSSKFEGDQSPISTKEKASIMGSEKSLLYDKISGEILGHEEGGSEKLGKSENLGMRKVETTRKSSCVCRSETQISKYRENVKRVKTEMKRGGSKKSCHLENKTPEERVNATHDTLHQVREKLENLHSVLRIYGQPMSQNNQTNSANQELAETILRELKNLGNFPESETDTKTQKSFVSENKNSDSNGDEISRKEQIPVLESTSEFEQCHSDPDFSSSSNYENCPTTMNLPLESCEPGEKKFHKFSSNNESCEKNAKNSSKIDENSLKIWSLAPSQENCDEKLSSLKFFQRNLENPNAETRDKKNSLEIPEEVREPVSRRFETEEKGNLDSSRSEKLEKINEKRKTDEKRLQEEQTVPSPISSTAECSKDSDTDEKSNASLLREALKFKNALMTQLEFENSSITKISTNVSDESESEEALWSKSKLHFQPKILDIISEEHSASSSTEKANKVREKKKPGESTCLKKIESNSSLKVLESKSSLIIIPEKVSESPENLLKPETNEEEKKIEFPVEENRSERPSGDLTTLVNESVLNIREYIEAFSQMQKEAIVEAKMSLRNEKVSYLEENADFSLIPEEKSSVDSITRFVNKIGITMSEELPRKLSEPAIIRLVDLSMENSEEDSVEIGKVDFSLRRRPGSTSLAENCEDRSIFESANSLDDFDEDLTSDFSCKRLIDYSSPSASDLTMEKPIDSPLTGRTVIRVTGSSTSNLDISTNDNNSLKSLESERIGNWSNGDSVEPKIDRENIDNEESRLPEDRFFQPEVLQESSSTYFTDQASFPDVRTATVDFSEQKFQRENDRWLCEEESCGKPEVESKSDVSIDRMDLEPETFEKSPRPEKTDDFFVYKPEVDRNIEDFYSRPEVEKGEEFIGGGEKKEAENRVEKAEVDENSRKNQSKSSTIVQETKIGDETLEKSVKSDLSKEEPEASSENSGNRPNSSETFVINSPRTKSRTSDISKLFNDSKSLYMDASSREFLNASGTSLRFEKGFLGSSKSARGSCSSPLRQNVHWNTPRRGSSLSSSEKSKRSSERMEKPKESLKSLKNSGNSTKNKNFRPGNSGLATKSHFNLNGTKDLESSSFGRRDVNSNVDLRERRSRSYATPRKSDFSPRNSANSELPTQRLSRDRKTQNPSKTESGTEKKSRGIGREGSSDRLDKNSSTISSSKETQKLRKSEKAQNSIKPSPIDSADSRDRLKRNSPSISSPAETQKLRKAEKIENPSKNSEENSRVDAEGSRDWEKKNYPSTTSNSETQKLRKTEILDSPSFSSSDPPKIVESTKSASLLSKNTSKSSIPVLRSRLEAVRQTSQEKRSKSPSRCALTMSTSSWGQENRSLPLFPAKNDPSTRKSMAIEPESCGALSKVRDSEIGKSESEKLGESRTVIYVNIVTEQEHKSATRIVDPKKFLEYLKDRELKIQSVQDQEIPVEKLENEAPSSPRILTIVSSAVEEKIGENSTNNSRGWSLRVEKREIEVSAKPSVIDTSTSISDLPDTVIQPQIPPDTKFQIFQVPKELTKDEYIVLLETLNQDPNLHQLREMHNLCNKLGLGFNE